MNWSRLRLFLSLALIFIVVEGGALLFTIPLKVSDIILFEDPASLENIAVYLLSFLIGTAFVLILIRYGLSKMIFSPFMRVVLFTLLIHIIMPLCFYLSHDQNLSWILAVGLSFILSVLLYLYPEWYIIDILSLVIALSTASMMGVSLEIIPVISILLLLSLYDALSVYTTKHMLTLGDGVLQLKLPLFFILPKRGDYSLIKDGVQGLREEGKDRDIVLIGTGDLVFPTILVVSSHIFYSANLRLFDFLNLSTLGAMIGSLCGLALLYYFMRSGRPHAGLPPLCTGTILGFIVGVILDRLI